MPAFILGFSVLACFNVFICTSTSPPCTQTHPQHPHPTSHPPHAGVTLKENNLKEIKGGHVLDSQGVLVANRRSLLERPGLMAIVHELLERFDAHLKAEQYYSSEWWCWW